MKRCIALLALLMAVSAIGAQRTYVLVTGVSSYQDSRNNVTQTTKNAKGFARLMQTQTPDVSILTSANASHDNILAKLKAICRTAGSADRIVFFFAGHGDVDQNRTGCILAYDRPLLYSELMECFRLSQSKEKIMLIEACHSGSTLSSYIDPDVVCLSSSRMEEYSYYNDLADAGFFSKALLVGLQGKADTNKDKKISVSELFRYAYSYVLGKSRGAQHPQLITSKPGSELIFFDCTKL